MITRPRAAVALIFAFVASTAILSQPAAANPVDGTKYAPFTLALYNKNVAESRKLAAYYAEKRGLPLDNIIGFDVPPGEVITREIYEKKIREPLVASFDTNRWWEREKDARGVLRPTTNKMKFAAIMYGMPLKIRGAAPQPTGETDPKTGEPIMEKLDHRQTEAASLDSELTVFGAELPNVKGPGASPYFRGNKAFGRTDMLLTSRIDGASYATAQRLIDDAIATEKNGLWGMGVIDVAQLAKQKGAGYEIGDKWLETCATFYHKAGIPTLVDRSPALIPAGYPIDDRVALYFGWYYTKVTGPFADRKFRFSRGAIAVHLHSYSASTMKNPNSNWTAPLIERGACASLGNVYEPYLTMTTAFDIFNARLLAGFTLAEAGWMATPTVSWMTLLVGDPLYQPFRRGQQYDMKTAADYKAYKLAVQRWGTKPTELMAQLDRAARSMKAPSVSEMAGLFLIGEKKYGLAAAQFDKAKASFTEPADKLRQDLHRARALAENGDVPRALALLRAAAIEFKSTPGAKAATALANQLDPPPPPPPAAK
jgi:uncharacterized protein (TIGR03790 family)